MATVTPPARRDDDPAPPARIAIPREDILDSYAHPYRRWLPLVLKDYSVHSIAAAPAGTAPTPPRPRATWPTTSTPSRWPTTAGSSPSGIRR